MIIYAFHPVLQLLLRKALLLQRLSIQSFLTPPIINPRMFYFFICLEYSPFSLFVKRVFFIFLLQFLIYVLIIAIKNNNILLCCRKMF